MYPVASENRPTETPATMTGRSLVWGSKYGGRERISRNIAIRRLRRRFRRAEKVSTWKSPTGYQKIDATNIGSLPTTHKDGASFDRPGSQSSQQGWRAYRAVQKKTEECRKKYTTREKRDKYVSYRITFPVVHGGRKHPPDKKPPLRRVLPKQLRKLPTRLRIRRHWREC